MKMKPFFLTALFCISTLAQLSASDNHYHKVGINLNTQEKSIAEAIKCLAKGLGLSRSIKDPDVREAVSAQLDFSLDVIEKEFFAKRYEEAIEEANGLYENIDEILSECTEAKIKDEILGCITAMMEALEGQ